MSIAKCMLCQNYRRPIGKYRTLFPSDCIGCGTKGRQEQVIPTETWQEICLTPHKYARQDSSLPSSKIDIPTIEEQTHNCQYLQIGYRHSKQNWSSKALHIFGNIVRRKTSSAANSCSTESQELSKHSSGAETRANPYQVEWPTDPDGETQSRGEDGIPASRPEEPDLLANHDCQKTKILEIGVNEDFVEPTGSSVDVLTLMQYRHRHYTEDHAVSVFAREASDQALSLKCCCSDADLTKPSMCGDRACVSCSVHDHRLIPRQVSMEAAAAAHAAVSVLAVPLAQVDPREDHQTSYTSVTTIPGNADVHGVLHSVRSALEYRQRLYRPTPVAHASVPSQTICAQNTEVSTCTTPSNQDTTATPIMHALGKMYHKHLYISALLHNLTYSNLKKLGFRVNECRTKIEELEDVCKQQKVAPATAEMAVGDEFVFQDNSITLDEGVGEGGPVIETFDMAVGEEDVREQKVDKETQDIVDIVDKIDGYTESPTFYKAESAEEVREEKVDKETQDIVPIIEKTDGCTEPTNFGIDTSVQTARDEGEGVNELVEIGIQVIGDEVGGTHVIGPVDPVVSEEPLRKLSQSSDLSSADIHSLNYCNPHLLEAYLLQSKMDNTGSIPEIKFSSSAEYLRQVVFKDEISRAQCIVNISVFLSGTRRRMLQNGDVVTLYLGRDPAPAKLTISLASASKTQNMSKQNYRICKPLKAPARPPIRRSPNMHQSPARYLTTKDRHSSSPPRPGVPPVAIRTHPIANPKRASAASARFAGGRSGMNNITLRRGAPVNKPIAMKFGSAKRK